MSKSKRIKRERELGIRKPNGKTWKNIPNGHRYITGGPNQGKVMLIKNSPKKPNRDLVRLMTPKLVGPYWAKN